MNTRWVAFVLVLAFVLAGCGLGGVVEVDQPASPETSGQEQAPVRAVAPDGVTYSGDDAYDPAAAGFQATGPDAASSDAGASGEDNLLPDTGALNEPRMSGNYSGDDPYDPAAGGLSR